MGMMSPTQIQPMSKEFFNKYAGGQVENPQNLNPPPMLHNNYTGNEQGIRNAQQTNEMRVS